MSENERAAQQAQKNAARPPEDYDDEGRPAASRARDAAHGPRGREGTGAEEDEQAEGDTPGGR